MKMATAQQQIQHEQQQHGRQQQSWATTPPGGGVQGACTLGTGKDASYLEQLLRQLHIRHEQAAGLLLTCPNLLEVEPQQASMLIRSMSKLLDCTHRCELLHTCLHSSLSLKNLMLHSSSALCWADASYA
eukprot:977472-Pelagomonas_calceolata.AAC.9